MKDERGQQLFGTLLSSKPAKTRSPMEWAIAIGLHAVLFVLLVFVSKPFIPKLASTLFENINIVIPADEPTVTIAPPTQAQIERALPAVRQTVQSSPAPGISLTPGPIVNEIPPPTAGPETVEPGDGGTGDGTLVGKLRPSKIDPRLNPGRSFGIPGDMSPAAAVRARIAQSIQEYNDSVAAELAAKERALDWTVKGKDGKEWGFSPGKIHLGDITLPFPVAFQPPPGKRDEIAKLNRDYAEIETMSRNEIGRQSFKDRVKAIRERKDKERAEKKKAQETQAPITN